MKPRRLPRDDSLPPKAGARTYRGTPRNLRFLAARLRAGELVAAPTETVYGLAANALDASACQKIFAAKGRPAADPLIVHIHGLDQLSELCTPNAAARKLAKAFWPGPLTFVLPKHSVVPDVVTSGRPSVAVRMPAHPLFRRLLKLARVPLAAPSANPFGYVSPTTAEHVRDGLGDKISYILDGGPAKIGLESSIVDLRDPERPRLLRPGAITRQEIERVLGRKLVTSPKPSGRGAGAQLAPGMLARHYSPRTPLVLHQHMAQPGDSSEAFVYLRPPAGPRHENVFILDPNGRLKGAARRLFATLRRLDRMGFRRIHVELAPGDGLAEAINDRLRRAAAAGNG
jgi:L-threonylcarbamoyladenylate synthase